MALNLRASKGFTLLECIVAFFIGILFLVSFVATLDFVVRCWQEENLRGRLRVQLEYNVERIRAETRLSDSNLMVFYPSTGGPYSAVSFPMASRNTDGFFTVGASGITWDKTVVYHVWTNGGNDELRRTTYASFDANPANRQTTLNLLKANGSDGAGSGVTEILMRAPHIELTLNSESPSFDGYAATASRSGIADFGSMRLSAGTHRIQFKIISKNSASTGYGMGLDFLQVSPSGGSREAENLTIDSTSGQAWAIEEMTPYGFWSVNHQAEYVSSAVDHYVTYQFYYDEWMESNFYTMLHSNTCVAGNNPHLTLVSREDSSLSPSWQALGQTEADAESAVSLMDTSVRTIVKGANLSLSGTPQLIRIKFSAPSTGGLQIRSAYFGVKGIGSAFDESVTAKKALYFSNPTVSDASTDGVGAIGDSGPTSSDVIPASSHIWTNWFEYPVSSAQNYLISFSVAASADSCVAAWTPLDVSEVNSFVASGDHPADTSAWPTSSPYNAIEAPQIYATSQIACWYGAGVSTSPIYDTKVDAPNYQTISWSSSGNVSLKIRTLSDPDNASTDWSSVAAVGSSPASLASLDQNRYVQFQATLTSASPYTTLPELDNVEIKWPGQTALVNLSGRYTKRPGYGVFKVWVDGTNPSKPVSIALTVSENFKSKSISETLTSEIRPKNTGR